ncbi:methyltransferase domain-containing protein [Nonomuraea sp. NPDC050786]|uniref:methyltransferase domain-containing protein n=1 Tax=Nonomuraea sp. NPDC050786 TaxID=3154840 RepID=UPI0033C0FD22
MNIENAVQQRYSAASRVAEPGLCCPVDYDPQYLAAIPDDVLAKDYGCGDPVSHVRAGERVLDLGSGAGKVCFIASQIVGSNGSVLGVDINDDMLAVARKAQPEVARRLGYGNVGFAKARIEDLALDLEFLDAHLARHPVRSHDDLTKLVDLSDRLRRDSPLVPDESIDVVISNCVLNLVAPDRKQDMFHEIARVLRGGGRAIISDIVSDIDVPAAMQADPDLWSGCYSGALQEERFLDGFIQAGLTGLTILKREARPWETVGDVEFRSVTIAAYKPLSPPPPVSGPAAIYRGPFATVTTDTGLHLHRGQVVPVSPQHLPAITSGAYFEHIMMLESEAPASERTAHPSDNATASNADGQGAPTVHYRPFALPDVPKGSCDC